MHIRSTTSRAIQLPLGALVSFSQALLICTYDGDKVRGSPAVITYLTYFFSRKTAKQTLLFVRWKRPLLQRSALLAATYCLDLPLGTLERSLPSPY
jgi:hypothetical protein